MYCSSVRRELEENTHPIFRRKASLSESGKFTQASRDLIGRRIEKASSVHDASDVVEEIQVGRRGEISQGISFRFVPDVRALPRQCKSCA